MAEKKKVLADVGLSDIPFPMRVLSRGNPEGQQTVATISIKARIIREFEPSWINTFVQIIHEHRDMIGTNTLKNNIFDYRERLAAAAVNIEFAYPYFIEKTTPKCAEKCLVSNRCTYGAALAQNDERARVTFRMEIPALTTDPASVPDLPGGLFGQLTRVLVQVRVDRDIYPEDLVEIVEQHALAPVYSFLKPEDQLYIIQKVHSEKITSMELADRIRKELSENRNIEWYSVRCVNFSMLHSYSTRLSTEKNMWIPYGSYDFGEM